MLKFIDENDFLLADKYKQNDDGSVSWIYNDGNATHSGFFREGMTRTIEVEDGTERVKVDEQQRLDENGEPIFNEDGSTLLEDVFEDQIKFKTETVDIWAKFQALVSKGAITLETEHLLLEQKQSAKDSINATRDALNDADIKYNGYTFQAGAQSREDIMGAVVTGGDTIWLTRDNQEIEMSAEDMRGLGLAIANRKKFLVYKARHFKDALDELSNEASIKDFISNLDWSA